MSGSHVDDLTAVTEPTVRTDKMFVGRSAELYQQQLSALRGGIIRRAPVQLVKPTTSDFATWVNQGSASLTDVGYALRMSAPHAGTSIQFNGAFRSLPSGNWDIQLGIRRRCLHKNYKWAGIILRESATGKCVSNHFGGRQGTATGLWASPTSYSGEITTQGEFHDTLFLRFAKSWNGVAANYSSFASLDGYLWYNFDTIALTPNFTTAPNQWGMFVAPVNEGTPNNPVTVDVFHWSEGNDQTKDIQPGVPTYGNKGGSFDRTAYITVTSTATFTSGAITNIVNGGFNNDGTDACVFTNGQSGRSITFQFPVAQVITEAKWYQNASQTNGTWKWQGSNDGSTFTDLSATFTLNDTTAGVGGTVIGDLSANNTAFLYYRLLQTAGTTSNAQSLKEIEFKIRKG